MHFLILGATGRNGKLIVEEALSSGHSVTALVRNPSSLAARANLTVVQGSPLSLASISEALVTPRAPSAVLLALSIPSSSEHNPLSPVRPDTPLNILERSASLLLQAIQEKAISPKIIVNSTVGVGPSWGSVALPLRLIFKYSPMRHTMNGHNALDALVKGSGMTYVMARAARLVDGEASAVKELNENGDGSGWNPTLRRKSLAKWMVQAAEGKQHDMTSHVLVDMK